MTEIDLSSFDSALWNITGINWTFNNCRALKKINFGAANLTNVTNTDNAFESCIALEEISPFSLSGANIGLNYCHSLKKESVIALFNALPTLTTSKTIYLNRIAYQNLTASEKAIITSKNWNLSSSNNQI